MTDKERWENNKSRKEIEDIVDEVLKTEDKEKISALWNFVESSPWEIYVRSRIINHLKIKNFFDHIPRFV